MLSKYSLAYQSSHQGRSAQPPFMNTVYGYTQVYTAIHGNTWQYIAIYGDTYILLDVLLCSIAEYLCRILASP